MTISAASCKAALCCSNLAATAITLEKLMDEFSDETLLILANIATVANEKMITEAVGED